LSGVRRVPSTAPWTAAVGYSRAVRFGDVVTVGGTVGIREDGEPAGPGAYAQARRAIEIIGDALEQAGASLADVVQTRMYVTDIGAQQAEVGRAHAEAFGEVLPAATMVEVGGFVDPRLVVEIEAVAYVGG
jgi:enamine deaminase RidA (YjgF/YER057c/UK114 family)